MDFDEMMQQEAASAASRDGRLPVAHTLEHFLAEEQPKKEPLVEHLLSRRDLVAFAARRRHGKTSFVTNLAVALASGPGEFLGYQIPEPRRSLLLVLEDDPGDFQALARSFAGQRRLGERIRLLNRQDFRAA